MASSDMDMLKDMGFDEERASMGLKRGGNVAGAIDWLEKNQDKSIDELKADAEEDGPALQPGEAAKSLVCTDCNKKFRSNAQAEFHATKSGHLNFDESTEEIAPLTEAEKKEKLAELKARAAERKLAQAAQDKAEARRNEEINRKKTKDMQDIKEELEKKEQIKAAAAKRKEKEADIAAKKRIKEKIEQDKEARRVKAEREKAARAGLADPQVADSASAASAPSVPKTTQDYTSARLKLQLPSGLALMKTYPVDTRLSEVLQAIVQEAGFEPTSLSTNFPKKTFADVELNKSLKEAGLVPSAVLIVK